MSVSDSLLCFITLYAAVLMKQNSSKSLHKNSCINTLTEPVTQVMLYSGFCAISWDCGGGGKSAGVTQKPAPGPVAVASSKSRVAGSPPSLCFFHTGGPGFSEVAKPALGPNAFLLLTVLFCEKGVVVD